MIFVQFGVHVTLTDATTPDRYYYLLFIYQYACDRCSSVLLLLLLLCVHSYSALSLQITNALHALCQYLANRKHLSDRLK